MENILRFISFEGLDFSGKSTQIRFLTESLKQTGQKVCLIREPGGTQISEKIKRWKSSIAMIPGYKEISHELSRIYTKRTTDLYKKGIVFHINFVGAQYFVPD